MTKAGPPGKGRAEEMLFWTKEEYLKVTRPSFGDKSFEAMQRFAIDCKKYVKTVIFTVVDVIGSEEITAAQEIADKLGIPLRVRKYES